MKAEQLLEHVDSGELWPPGSADFEDLPAAYRTAMAVEALRQARGETPRGYKIGFTNRTIWSRYRVFAPIWGSVWDSTVSTCDGAAVLSLARLCQPRIEPEAVFGFNSAPQPGAGVNEVFEALAWVAPGFEIVQSHMPDWKFVAAQTVADGGLHGRLLVGTPVPIATIAQDAGQLHRILADAQVALYRGDTAVDQGSGANVLDSPLQALMHFIAALHAWPGARGLAAGDIITTGTWTDAWPVQAGQTWSARFDAVLPALNVSFVP